MIAFQRKHDGSILLLSDNKVSIDMESDCHNIIIAYPQKVYTNLEVILKMIADTSEELGISDKVIIYKYLSQVSLFVLTW